MLVVLGAPAVAAPAPIRILDCGTGTAKSDMLIKTDGNYTIEFINDDAKTAETIYFVVHLGAQTIYIKDVGTFSSNVAIKHTFRNLGGEVALASWPQLACEVKSVKFSDGSAWSAR